MNLLRPGLYGKLAYKKHQEADDNWQEASDNWQEACNKYLEARDEWQEALKSVPYYLRSILDEPA